MSVRGTPWTKQEIRKLRQFFGRCSNIDMANKIQRTPKAIERKAAKLGLSKSKKYLRSLGRKV
jgi:hypothetical protein